MGLSKERKSALTSEFRIKEGDTGSSAVQVALLTEHIRDLTEHLKIHPKDLHSRRGLQLMVNRRNRLLKYIYRCNHESYRDLVNKLNIRGKLDKGH